MNPATVPGFRVDEAQCLAIPDGCRWNQKAGSRWLAEELGAPPPKSRLLAAHPNHLLLAPTPFDGPADYDATDNVRESTVDEIGVWGKP